ncbi:MAG: hypothetical protein ABSE62_05075 [Chthoniobacteraceae bacterium]|jgi:hypothetical protein
MNPMAIMLRRKLEKAVIAFVKGTGDASLKAQIIVEGHANVEPEVPYHVVYATDSRPHEDLPAEVGVSSVTVVWHQKSDANDEDRAAADARLEDVFYTLLAPVDLTAAIGDENRLGGALLLALNKPLTGPDNRAVKGLHVYDFFPADDRDSMDGDKWHDQLVFTAVAQPFDQA